VVVKKKTSDAGYVCRALRHMPWNDKALNELDSIVDRKPDQA
jgi:hypothetical protein